MKVAQFEQFGAPEVLQLREVETPTPKPGHALVKILAAGVNRLEHYLREGSITRELALPHVLGSDAAAEVVELGAGVTGLRRGERVIPMPGYPLDAAHDDVRPLSSAPSYAIAGILRWGTYAQYLELPARWLMPDTTGLAPEQVATLPMVLVTAVRALRTVAEVQAGQHVLIHAGTSGTGSISVQVAKALGAVVLTTVDAAEKVSFAEELGADLVITEPEPVPARDYCEPDVIEGKPLECCRLCAVGQEVFAGCELTFPPSDQPRRSATWNEWREWCDWASVGAGRCSSGLSFVTWNSQGVGETRFFDARGDFLAARGLLRFRRGPLRLQLVLAEGRRVRAAHGGDGLPGALMPNSMRAIASRRSTPS